ncbi:MAG: ATP-binding protein [Candidatus Methanomethylophilaceae archaeon]|nr:ATP-binding protein [Candidatus Methanomethylophilaceae archaeon]
MKRKIEAELSRWKDDPHKKPLIMLGCRQVGKTYSIHKFVSDNYESFLEVNLEREPSIRDVFRGSLDAATIIDKLVIISGKKLIPGRSAIFLDEIQASPEAYSSLKWLAEDNRFDILASGSFLGTSLFGGTKEDYPPISPLGYVKTLTMYPMDFEEYLWAMGVDERMIASVRESIESLREIDASYNRIMTEHFRRYMIVGGMPEAVRIYSETRDYHAALSAIRDVIHILQMDAGKYSRNRMDKMKILACMESIPSQLASDKRRFQFVDVEKTSGGRRRYGDALEWLINAGMAYRCYNLFSVNPPLSHNLKETMFKIYLCDTGLLMGLMDDADPGAIVISDPFSNNGIVMENAVASALVKKGYPLYYYAKENSTLEIDFVLNHGEIWLLEVKSGKSKRSKSLNTLLSEKDRKRRGFKVCEGNILGDENGAVHLPLYGACFLPESTVDDILPVGPAERAFPFITVRRYTAHAHDPTRHGNRRPQGERQAGQRELPPAEEPPD